MIGRFSAKHVRLFFIVALVAIAVLEWASIRERMFYRRFTDSMTQTGAVLIEMDQRTNIITAASRGSADLFGRDIVGVHVHDLMPPEYRANHDSAVDRVNRNIDAGTFRPHVMYRQAYIKTANGKMHVNLRVYATAQSRCYAIVDPLETKE